MTREGDPRASGRPHYFVPAVFARRVINPNPTCAACGKPPDHPWHLKEPFDSGGAARRLRAKRAA